MGIEERDNWLILSDQKRTTNTQTNDRYTHVFSLLFCFPCSVTQQEVKEAHAMESGSGGLEIGALALMQSSGGAAPLYAPAVYYQHMVDRRADSIDAKVSVGALQSTCTVIIKLLPKVELFSWRRRTSAFSSFLFCCRFWAIPRCACRRRCEYSLRSAERKRQKLYVVSRSEVSSSLCFWSLPPPPYPSLAK